MSRSYHQRHPTSRGRKFPREILEMYKKDGITYFIFRKRKIKPYGRKNFIGWGAEMWSQKYGEYMGIYTNKKRERRIAKNDIIKEINHMEL